MKTRLLCSAIAFMAVAVMLFIPLRRITSHIYISYNEGWNAYNAIAARHGKIYGNAFTPVNYPPLSFYFLRLFPDPLFAGRIVSLVSLFSCSVIVTVIVYRLKKDIYSSVCAGVLTLAIFLGLSQNYVGVNDPQMLAQAIMLGSLYLYLFRKNLFATALVAVIALFIKHNLLAIPMCICLDLLFKSRRDLLKFVLYTIGLTTAMTLIFQLTDSQFIPSMLLKREYALSNLAYVIKMSLPILPLLTVVLFIERRSIFCYYFISSLVVGLFFSVGIGTDVNLFFDLFLSTAILSGFVLAQRRGFAYLVLFQAVILLLFRAYQHTLYFSVSAQEKEANREIAIMRSTPGDALCENIALCYYSGKKFLYDPYLVYEAVATHAMQESQTTALLKSHTFSILQLNNPNSSQQLRFTGGFYNQLRKEYVLSGGFYVLPANR